MHESLYRELPGIDRVLDCAATDARFADLPRAVVVAAARAVLNERRAAIGAASGNGAARERLQTTLALEAVLSDTAAHARRTLKPGISRAINATGVILHTNLGRAVLAEPARRAIQAVAGACTLEMDVASGQRGERLAQVERLLVELSGAEAACVVNNNAAATMLALHTFADGREAICARGQLVEIGGSFRMPDVMTQSGCTLREVGATNRVRLSDYADAIGERTGAIIKVHTSNYRIVGFTSEVPIDALVKLGREHQIPVIDDLGSGALAPLSAYGFADEPLVRDSIAAGADLVCFSGDKLVGASQAGILVGRRAAIGRVRTSPLYRILRVGKLDLAALEATLPLFLEPETLTETVPTWRMLAATLASLAEAAQAIAARIRKLDLPLSVRVLAGNSQLGSGSLPGVELPTMLVGLDAAEVSAQTLAARLREHRPPVFARITDDCVWLDPRTIQPGDLDQLIEALSAACAPRP